MAMNPPNYSTDRVLLICPVRNEAAFIPRLLLSLKAQSHSNWIILFIDNASTDKTNQIISKALEDDDRIILQTFHLPIPINENFNRAIQIATKNYSAQFIGFIGGDDFFLERTYLEDLVLTLKTRCSIAIPTFKIQEVKELDSYLSTFSCLSNFPIVNRIMQGWNSNYGNIFYSLFRWEDFLLIISDRRSRLSSNLSSDWWFVNTALRVTRFPPKFVPSATYIKFNKRKGYDSEYYHANAPHQKSIGLQSILDAKSEKIDNIFNKTIKTRFENIIVVPMLIILREWKRIQLRDSLEFILVLSVMISTRLRLAIKNYLQKRYN